MQRPANKSAAIIVAVVLMLPVVYVLSVGPVVRLVQQRIIGDELARSIYKPLAWAMEHSTAVNWTINRYLNLWGVPTPDS